MQKTIYFLGDDLISLTLSCALRLPESFRALEIINSICPFTLRNSSAAHFSNTLKVSESIRNIKFFFVVNANNSKQLQKRVISIVLNNN